MSTKIVIKTTDRVVPMIYAYTTPEIARHNGWTKIGYTEQDVDKRLSQQTHTADVELFGIKFRRWLGIFNL
jgi:DNA or RNA helicases of superfamily II